MTLTRKQGAARATVWLLGLALAWTAPAAVASSDGPARVQNAVEISGGAFQPFFADAGVPPTPVRPFLLDRYPVTNADYAEFLLETPAWRRGAPPSVLASPLYLRHWGELSPEEVRDSETLGPRPVTNISWFAAAAYCDAQGGRLANEAEWELVGLASRTELDASEDPAHARRLLAWYERPRQQGSLDAVGQNPPNAWGVYDMHGLVWEWVSDFNASLVSGSRSGSSEKIDGLFCGGASVDARSSEDYAAFMRYAFRSSLHGSYVMHSLGFRCAYNLEATP